MFGNYVFMIYGVFILIFFYQFNYYCYLLNFIDVKLQIHRIIMLLVIHWIPVFMYTNVTCVYVNVMCICAKCT